MPAAACCCLLLPDVVCCCLLLAAAAWGLVAAACCCLLSAAAACCWLLQPGAWRWLPSHNATRALWGWQPRSCRLGLRSSCPVPPLPATACNCLLLSADWRYLPCHHAMALCITSAHLLGRATQQRPPWPPWLPPGQMLCLPASACSCLLLPAAACGLAVAARPSCDGQSASPRSICQD